MPPEKFEKHEGPEGLNVQDFASAQVKEGIYCIGF